MMRVTTPVMCEGRKVEKERVKISSGKLRILKTLTRRHLSGNVASKIRFAGCSGGGKEIRELSQVEWKILNLCTALTRSKLSEKWTNCVKSGVCVSMCVRVSAFNAGKNPEKRGKRAQKTKKKWSN